MKADDIITWYSEWTPEQGIEQLIEARQHLAVAIYRASIDAAKAEKQHIVLEDDLKLRRAVKFFECDETSGEKKLQRARILTEDQSKKVAEAYGQVKGYKHYIEGLTAIDRSMASWINRERNL